MFVLLPSESLGFVIFRGQPLRNSDLIVRSLAPCLHCGSGEVGMWRQQIFWLFHERLFGFRLHCRCEVLATSSGYFVQTIGMLLALKSINVIRHFHLPSCVLQGRSRRLARKSVCWPTVLLWAAVPAGHSDSLSAASACFSTLLGGVASKKLEQSSRIVDDINDFDVHSCLRAIFRLCFIHDVDEWLWNRNILGHLRLQGADSCFAFPPASGKCLDFRVHFFVGKVRATGCFLSWNSDTVVSWTEERGKRLRSRFVFLHLHCWHRQKSCVAKCSEDGLHCQHTGEGRLWMRGQQSCPACVSLVNLMRKELVYCTFGLVLALLLIPV